jgi:hypothetical protein
VCTASLRKSAEPASWPHGGCLRLANVPHARRRAREGERSLQPDSKNIAHVPLNLPQHTSPDPKMPQDPRKGAIMAWARICVIIRENRNQTIKCRTKIKESIPLVNTTIPYHPEKESKQSKYRYRLAYREMCGTLRHPPAGPPNNSAVHASLNFSDSFLERRENHSPTPLYYPLP